MPLYPHWGSASIVVFGGSFNFAHTYLPAGKYTVPWIFPAASSALCIAAVSDVFPSPFAPKSRTLKTLFFDGQSEPSAAAESCDIATMLPAAPATAIFFKKFLFCKSQSFIDHYFYFCRGDSQRFFLKNNCSIGRLIFNKRRSMRKLFL